jgi:1,4-dihydroxy-2-naphthoate octaprenyltransferase
MTPRQQIGNFLGIIRAPFLSLTLVNVFLGITVSQYRGAHIDTLLIMLILIGALAAHISINALNEYYDFKSGLDLNTTKTPYNGGSGTLPENPDLAKHACRIGYISLVLTALCGVYFINLRDWQLFPLGLLGILIIIGYTNWITRRPFLCLISPGLGFGPLMVMGTDYVISGDYSLIALIISFIPFFLVNNLLLLNQYPDNEADMHAGRRHFPLVIGKKNSFYIFLTQLLMSYSIIPLGLFLGLLPPNTLAILITLPLSIVLARGVFLYLNEIEKLVPYMGLNVILVLVTPVILGGCLLLA